MIGVLPGDFQAKLQYQTRPDSERKVVLNFKTASLLPFAFALPHQTNMEPGPGQTGIGKIRNIIGNLRPGAEMRIIFQKIFQPIVSVIGFVSKYGWQPTTQQTSSTLHYQLNSDVIELKVFQA